MPRNGRFMNRPYDENATQRQSCLFFVAGIFLNAFVKGKPPEGGYVYIGSVVKMRAQRKMKIVYYGPCSILLTLCK